MRLEQTAQRPKERISFLIIFHPCISWRRQFSKLDWFMGAPALSLGPIRPTLARVENLNGI